MPNEISGGVDETTSVLGSLDTQFFHAGSQRALRHPKYRRSAVLTIDFPLCMIQHLEDIISLHFFKRLQVRGPGLGRDWQDEV